MKFALVTLDKAQVEVEVKCEEAPDLIIHNQSYFIYEDYKFREETYYYNQIEPSGILEIKE